jgi:glycosyltransferase involved in cell wall biosynthesis
MRKNTRPLVSVIIPNYNHTRFLPNAIQSVLAQHYPNYEIIIVDDGSTDDSREVVAQFGDKVQYIWQNNQGLAGARNTGIRAASGELIGLLDADDEWAPDYLEQMMVMVDKNPDAIVFYCMAQCMDMDGRDLPQFVGGPPLEPGLLYQKLLRANFIIPSTVIFRKKPIVDVGYFDATLRSCEDWDLWLRLLPSFTIRGSHQSLVRYRLHGNSLSKNVVGMHSAAQQVIEKHFDVADSKPTEWTSDKRRAYGGLYRYQVLTYIQRQNNWEAATGAMRKAFEIDPTLTVDLDFFYELAFGTQPLGYRETAHEIELEKNIQLITKLLENVFKKQTALKPFRRRAFGTANYAMGLVAYNLYKRDLSRKLLFRAAACSPKLLLDKRMVFLVLKSYLNPLFLIRLKRFIDWGTYADSAD